MSPVLSKATGASKARKDVGVPLRAVDSLGNRSGLRKATEFAC
jgi:hypothetical protein